MKNIYISYCIYVYKTYTYTHAHIHICILMKKKRVDLIHRWVYTVCRHQPQKWMTAVLQIPLRGNLERRRLREIIPSGKNFEWYSW